MKKETLPIKAWNRLLPFIQQAGEGAEVDQTDIAEEYRFLIDLRVFDSATYQLTEAGRHIFESLFIRRDQEAAIATVRELLLGYAPTVAMQQYLWGVRNIDVDQVLVVLKTTGHWTYASLEPLTHFLDLLNQAGIISYNRKTRTIKVLISPDTERVPRSVFVDPSRPFSNLLWIKRILGECEGYIYWLDKHFQKEALEWIWSAADAVKVREIKILSLDLGEPALSSEVKKQYARLKTELANKGIDFQWLTIDSKLIRDTHDRWIIGDKGYVRNVPNVNAISSGQRSEMNASENHTAALSAFSMYLKDGVEVGS